MRRAPASTGRGRLCVRLSRDRGGLYVLRSHCKFALRVRKSLRSLQRPLLRKERAAHRQISYNCDSSRSSCVYLCVCFVRPPLYLTSTLNCRAVTVVSSRSFCVCSFRASFLLEQRAASFELLAVLRVTLQLVAIAFISLPSGRINAQQTLNYVCEDILFSCYTDSYDREISHVF